MLGPHGTGLLWVAPGRRDELLPTDVGAWCTATYSLPDQFQWQPTARRFEGGTQDASRAAGLARAAEFLQDIGMERVAAHGAGLGRQLRESLAEIRELELLSPSDPVLASSITTFRSARMAIEPFYKAVSAAGFRVRIVQEDGLNAIRISSHVYNHAGEISALVEAVRLALQKS